MRYLAFPFVLASLMLSACGTTSAPPVPVTISTDSFAPLALNARKLEIIDNWQMPMASPYIGHRQDPFPSNLVARWGSAVLMPAGGSGEIVLDISRAAVTQERLVREDKLSNALVDEQDMRLRVELEAQLMWLQPVGGSQARIKLSALHSVTVPESANANDVQTAINECLQAALVALDAQARAELAKIDSIILP